MSEHLKPSGPEFKVNNPETEFTAEQHRHTEKEPHNKHEKKQESVEKITSKVEQHAISGKEYAAGEKSESKNHPVIINKQLKDMAYSRALTRARKKLSAPSRSFSKVIHSKAVERPSEAIGKTVARPSGMLGGAVFALVGTSILLWIANKYGYEYNYLAVMVLFAVGLVVGLFIEGITRLVRGNQD